MKLHMAAGWQDDKPLARPCCMHLAKAHQDTLVTDRKLRASRISLQPNSRSEHRRLAADLI